MFGTEKTKAFCCDCNKLTLHKYTNFSHVKPTAGGSGGFFSNLLEIFARVWLPRGQSTGDYKCTCCGTFLSTPDSWK